MSMPSYLQHRVCFENDPKISELYTRNKILTTYISLEIILVGDISERVQNTVGDQTARYAFHNDKWLHERV